MQHLHSSCGQRFPTNNLYTCIYYNKHRAISTKQTYISKTDGDTDRIQSTSVTFFETNYLKLALFTKIYHSLMNSRKESRRRNQIKYQSNRSVSSANRLRRTRSMSSGSSSSIQLFVQRIAG